jgi:hypothetical protein
MMKKCKISKIMAFSLPSEIIDRIDIEKGDVSRSRFLLRLIEKAYDDEEKEALKK